MIDMFKIKEYKKDFETFKESSVIQNLFNIEEKYVDELFGYGFEFNYTDRYFHTQIIINNIEYKIFLFKVDLVKERLIKYFVHFKIPDENSRDGLNLIGVSPFNEFSLYYDITNTNTKINIYAMLNYIYTVYKLNQKEGSSFKEFVSNEKLD